jgi:hypothetical protein
VKIYHFRKDRGRNMVYRPKYRTLDQPKATYHLNYMYILGIISKTIPHLAETAAVSCQPRGVKAVLSDVTRAVKPALSALLGYS